MHPIATIFTIMVTGFSTFLTVAQAQAPSPAKRTIPPTVYLSFPKTVVVDTVYIYPTCIAFRSRSGLKPHAKLIAEFSNLYERAPYSRVVSCHYLLDDDTFWIEMPDDIPSEVSIAVRRKP
jgi:hypothetical protein